jgi:soluble lytic murein transglycosylase-like protein
MHYSNHDAARPNAFAAYGSLNSGGFASPYAQNSFGQTPSRDSLYNVSAISAGQAGASGLPSSLIQRVIARESGGNPRAVHAGNYGLMQIRLGTARAMGYTGSAAGLLDPQTNMTYGLRYLAGAYRAAGGNESRAIALYQRGYYYQAKAQSFSPYSSGSVSTAGYGGTFGYGANSGFQSFRSAGPFYAEQYGVRHRRHYRV